MKRYLAVGILFLVALPAYPAIAGFFERVPTILYLVPPGEVKQKFGMSFDELFGDYFLWFWNDWYEPGDLPEVGQVTYVRGFQSDGEEPFNRVRRGQYLAVPLVHITGETYKRELFPADDPDDYPPREYLEFQIYVDGVLVLDGDDLGVRRYLFKVKYFDDPIEYPVPEYRFTDDKGTLDTGDDVDAYAVSSIWSEGTGCIVRPLSVGNHLIKVVKHYPSFNTNYTDMIHVRVTR